MTPGPTSSAIAQYVEDELLRAPLIWDQLLDAVLDPARQMQMARTQPFRPGIDDLPRLLEEHWSRMAESYLGSLRAQAEQAARPSATPPRNGDPDRSRGKRPVLELVDLDSVALDVEITRVVQAVRDAAEQELRDLQALLATVVGDVDIEDDHNPLHPAAHGRALRAGTQALQAPLQLQLAFLRLAMKPFAHLLRQTYAASCARLEEAGIEPATHRCIVLHDGRRHLQASADVAHAPDLHRIRDAMPRTARHASSRERVRRLARAAGADDAVEAARATSSAGLARGGAIAREHSGDPRPPDTVDRQAVELVNRLFKAFPLDERVPDDVCEVIGQLRGPAMRLALRDPTVLDRREHPIWQLIHLFAYQAEMVPKVNDPERLRWLKFGRQTVAELAAAPMQKTASYQSALERMEAFLQQRLAQRCAALAARFEVLQATEAGLAATLAGAAARTRQPSAAPAANLQQTSPGRPTAEEARIAAEAWFDGLVPGQWVRLQLKGTWLHAQLLWQGDRRQIVMLGDGASATTWAMQRAVLLTLHCHGLAKTLQMRSLVRTAALRVQEQMIVADAA